MAESEEGKNAKYTRHNMELMTLPPLDLQLCSGKALEERCIFYFESCIENDMRPSVAGFSLAIGISRPTLMGYLHGETKCPLDVKDTLNRFYAVLNAMMEDYMQGGVVNPIPAIFLLKNNFGYKDTQDVVVNNKQDTALSEDKLVEEAKLLLEESPKLANIDE
jgi:hypothetical protein